MIEPLPALCRIGRKLRRLSAPCRLSKRPAIIFNRRPTGQAATLTNWSFSHHNRVQTPAGYLKTLPPAMSAMLVNHGLQNRTAEGDEAKLLIHRNGSFVCRAATSGTYARIWNYELLERVRR